MVAQEPSVDRVVSGSCADCGAVVVQRMACVDVATRSTVELCAACWNAYRQRQVFSAGCCG
ncbi:MAG: hypothetical protein ABL970_13870 [Nitrospira sp.]